jgi:hypothetical protein
MYGGGPIKSAGMFYIKAMQGTQVLQMSWSKKITVTQPLNGLPIDTAMRPLIFQWGVPGTILGGWNPAPQDSMGWPVDSLYWTLSNYIFSLYQFSAPSDSGTWSNSDNCSFFSGYPQTTLTLNPLDSYSTYYTEVFLLFSGINSMVHVYWNGTNFPYYYAPAGLQCTAVAVGVKGGKLYSSFKPLTISTNLTVNFSLSETTTADFKAQLNALN